MIHINSFIDRVTAADVRNQRELTMTLKDAKALHADITKLLLVLHELRKNNEPIEVFLNGSDF